MNSLLQLPVAMLNHVQIHVVGDRYPEQSEIVCRQGICHQMQGYFFVVIKSLKDLDGKTLTTAALGFFVRIIEFEALVQTFFGII